MATIEYKKKKYFKGRALIIGKERPDICSAQPTDTIRVLFEDTPKITIECLRSTLSKDVTIPQYPHGAWEVPESNYKVITK